MLPSKGYFKDIECPYFDSSCNRAHCHFRHRKKTIETVEDSTSSNNSEILIKEAEAVPTYKPTPKSELANNKSHIPISYVPDLAFRSARTTRPLPKFDKPTYKPTPKSVLSSANKQKDNVNVEDNKNNLVSEVKAIENQISSEYIPSVKLQDEINFENLDSEFDLIDDIINETCAEEVEEKSTIVDKKKSNSSNDKDKSEKSEKKKTSSSSSSKSNHKSRHSSSSSSSKNDTKDKRHKDDKRRRSRSRDRHKSKHKSRDKEKSKSDDNKKKSSSSSSHGKNSSSSSSSRKKEKSISKEESNKIESDELPTPSDDFNISDVEFDYEEDDTLLECYKIFNEYKPPSPPKPTTEQTHSSTESTVDNNSLFGKKRVAHSSTSNVENVSKITFNKPKSLPTAAEIMVNRLKQAKLAQGSNEQKNINEIKHQSIKRPAPPEATKANKLMKLQATPKPSATVEKPSLIDSIINASKTKPKKIAPVMNVNSIQRAKAKIDELAKQKAVESLNKTPAQNIKGVKRAAHVPDMSLSDIPDVLNADKSKLPINVRTRFLTMIADECLKLYLIKEDAYNRALNEEFACYEKCKVLATYKNSSMLAVSRLRKELQERVKNGLGPIGVDEATSDSNQSITNMKTFYDRIQHYLMSEEDLDVHGYPRESEAHPGRAVIKNRLTSKSKITEHLDENQRKCARCSTIYKVDALGYVMHPEYCIYHPLKKRTFRGQANYLCCKSSGDTGCATSSTHVCDFSDQAELEGFQKTLPPDKDDDPRSYAVYALDCEMCYTTKGLELTRVTIVDADCKSVYETLVKPLNPIVDYNTVFSGITKEQMDKTSTSILQVQANILHLCNSKTILIGHSLESDMKALKIIHGTIIDTAVLFPHKMGLPHKRALRALATDYLKKIIQNNVSGHDSAEDAITCMELVKWKLKEELKVRGIK